MPPTNLKTKLFDGKHVSLRRVREALRAGVDPEEIRAVLAGADLDFPSDADRRAAARLLGESGSPSAGAPSGGHRVHDLRTVHQTVGRWWEGAGLPEVAVTFAVGTAKDVIVDGERFTPVDVARILRALA